MTSGLSDDKYIVSLLRQGDRSTFEFLFKTYYRKLCMYAAGILKEKEAAEEVVGNFFLKFWENHQGLDIHISLKSYLYTSIYNNSLNYLEHLKVLEKYRDYATYVLDNKDLLQPVSENYPLANLISQEIVHEIEEAIQSLPEQCREVFCLSRFKELSYEEIAASLDVSINTVRTQMSRALQKLRDRLKEYLPVFIGILFVNI